MTSPENQHCASCIGTLAFPLCQLYRHTCVPSVPVVSAHLRSLCASCIGTLAFPLCQLYRHTCVPSGHVAQNCEGYALCITFRVEYTCFFIAWKSAKTQTSGQSISRPLHLSPLRCRPPLQLRGAGERTEPGHVFWCILGINLHPSHCLMMNSYPCFH